MSLSQRVRDIRYSKGWGPDELANRAEISRTALYQIESGKTGLPRAGTLRRIAVALDVPMEDLLGHEDGGVESPLTPDPLENVHRSRGLYDWLPSDGGALSLPPVGALRNLSANGSDDKRFKLETSTTVKSNGHDSVYVREGELMSKLHDLLHSPMGDGIARILEEMHALIPRSRSIG